MAEDTENPSAERETNPLEYSEKYFELQVAFAKRWADITGTPFTETLLRNTDLYRLVTTTYPQTEDYDSRLTDATKHVKDADIKHISHAIFGAYANQAHSRYQIPKSDEIGHFGPFSYVVGDWLNTPQTVRIHFANHLPRGKEGPLSRDQLNARRLDVKAMVDDIHTHHPTATEVVGRSWLYSVTNYRACFPDEYVNTLSRLVPPGFESLFPGSVGHLSFHGTSMWDQFQNRYGWVPEQTAQKFQVAIEQSSDTTGLLNAFPYLPFQAKAPITAFYDWDPQQS